MIFAANLLVILALIVSPAIAGLAPHYPPYSKTTKKAEIVTSCTEPGTVALTFDDGPHNYIYQISKALEEADAKATFFFNGNNYDCIYSEKAMDQVRYAYNKGHQIASHTWAHKDLTTLSWEEINDEMWRTEQALQRIIGVIPAFMRPPYGNYNEMVQQAAHIRKQTVVIWDFDSLDSDGASAEDSKRYYDDLIKKHPSSILALNHETYYSTAYDVIPHAIKALKKAGYKLVTLAECLGMEPYQVVGEPQKQSSSWEC